MACNVITTLHNENVVFPFMQVQSIGSWCCLARVFLWLLQLLTLPNGKMKWKYSIWLFAKSTLLWQIFICKLKFPFYMLLSHFICHSLFIKKDDVSNGIVCDWHTNRRWIKISTTREQATKKSDGKNKNGNMSQRVNLIKACNKTLSEKQPNKMELNKSKRLSHRFWWRRQQNTQKTSNEREKAMSNRRQDSFSFLKNRSLSRFRFVKSLLLSIKEFAPFFRSRKNHVDQKVSVMLLQS